MSDDPRDRYGDVPHNPIGDAARDPYGAPLPDPYAQQTADAARGRVLAPAIFLIVIAVLNLVAALGMGGIGAAAKSGAMDEAMEKQWEDYPPETRDQLEKQGWSGKTMGDLGGDIYLGLGAAALLASLLILFGAFRMLYLKSYGLAIFASILAAIPCLSPSSCGLVGIIAGLWALIVLASADVRAAFR